MEHKYWEERLQGFIDNELGPADRLAVQAHVDECPDCKVNLKYFRCLKERLHVHAGTVSIPRAVEDRLNRLFLKRRNPFRHPRTIATTLAVAAALLIGFLLPTLFQKPYAFVDSVMTGKIVCYDCEVAARVPDLERGDLCSDGHEMGLQADDGHLWRFARDQESVAYSGDKALFGKEVRIWAQTLAQERMIRIKNLEMVTGDQASFRSPGIP